MRRRNKSQVPAQLKSQATFPRSPWVATFLTTTVIASSINLGLEAYVFYQFWKNLDLSSRENTTARTIPTYLAIYLVSFVFQILLAFFAVGKRNTIQILGLVFFNFAILVYSGIQIREFHNVLYGTLKPGERVFESDSTLNQAERRKPFFQHLLPMLVAVPTILGVAQTIYVISAIHLYREFGWDIYQKLGADRAVKRYYFTYQVLVVFLIYDWYFFGGFTMQLLILNVQNNDWEFYVTIAALPVTGLGLIGCLYAVKSERRPFIWAFDLCLAAAFSYFIFKLYRIYAPESADEYNNDKITLTVFAVVSILLLVSTFAISLRIERYFGRTPLWEKQRPNDDTQDDSTPLGAIEMTDSSMKRVLLD